MFGPITTLAALLVLAPGNAETHFVNEDAVRITAAVSAERPAAPAIRTSLANLDYEAMEVSSEEPPSALQAPSSKPQRSLGRKVAGGVAGAVAGFFAGRYFGQAIGGYGGSIIGGPAGAIVGGILGVKF